MKASDLTGGIWKMIKRYLIGNAQTIGCREIQNNFFSTAYNDDGDLLAVLADGTIDHPNGRIAAILAVECCILTFTQRFSLIQTVDIDRFLLETALKANRRVQDAIYLGRSPRLSLTMVLLSGKSMHFFNVGVNRIFLYNGHNEQILGNYLNDSYSYGAYNLSSKDIVGMLSSGAYTDAHPMERIRIMDSSEKIFDKAQAIIESINNKGLEIQLNATALLIEVAR
jgi:hypothetical protein